MAEKKVIWSIRAQNDRHDILEYWINRNKSTSYSIKLNNLFKEAEHLIAIHPEIGKHSDIKSIRIKIIRDYLMIYKITEDVVQILTLRDARKDPDELERIIKNSR